MASCDGTCPIIADYQQSSGHIGNRPSYREHGWSSLGAQSIQPLQELTRTKELKCRRDLICRVDTQAQNSSIEGSPLLW